MVVEVVRASYALLLLKQGPQDMPAGQSVTLGLAAVYFLSSFALLVLQGAELGLSVVEAGVDLAILAGFVRLVLWKRGFPARFGQTLSALLVAGFVFGLLSLPSIHALLPYMHSLAHASGHLPKPTGAVMLAYLGLVVVVVWSLTVMVHVLRHALEVGVAPALGLTILYQLVSLFIMSLLFGGGSAH